MEKIVIKKDLLKITKDFTLGVILNEIIEIAQNFRKEFIDNNWHCPDFFEMNIEKIAEDNMLNASKSSMRRYIKKLEKLGFISIDKLEKKHRYKVNFETINKEIEKINGEIIEKIKATYKKEKKQVEKSENSKKYEENSINVGSEFDGYTQTNMFEEKKAPYKDTEQVIHLIKNNINYYNIINEMSQDKDFIKMYDSIYRILVDVMTTDAKYIRVAGDKKPVQVVRSIFSKINSMDVLAVIDKVKYTNRRIVNIKNYIITTIYNWHIENTFQLQNALYVNEGLSL